MKMLLSVLLLVSIVLCLLVISCKKSSRESTQTVEQPVLPTIAPDWAKSANIYEINIRQFTKEGTFRALEAHLPRISEMGVDILWLMPIFPISEKNKKGSLGSYYAVSDFRKINPEFGTMEDFKKFVKSAHMLGMKIILDWVPNHTGWDHVWIKEHPEYYTQDSLGKILDPIDPATGKSWGWTDVADLNFDNQEMRKAMISDMQYWLVEAEVDGFRMDVAHNVPDDFWDQAVPALRSVKNIFLLAESEVPSQRNSGNFAATYAWSLHHLMNKVAKGEKKPTVFDKWLLEDRAQFNRGYHMVFITNHDENSWQGTEYERMGDAVDAMAVFSFTFDGMPLIYSGQESGFNRRLNFFDKDSIDWGTYSKKEFYKTLINLKHQNQALWNGEHGGAPVKILTGKENEVYAFYREKNGDRVIVVLNFSANNQEITLKLPELTGTYQNVFAGSTMAVSKDATITLGPWEYLVLSNKF